MPFYFANPQLQVAGKSNKTRKFVVECVWRDLLGSRAVASPQSKVHSGNISKLRGGNVWIISPRSNETQPIH